MASYPSSGPVGRNGSTGRKQKKFVRREDGERFLEREKERYKERWGWEKWGDGRLREDAGRAVEILSTIAGGTLEKAARVYEECRRAQEWGQKREGTEENGVIELSERLGLGVGRLAARRGMSKGDLVAAVLWAFIEQESQGLEQEDF